MEQYGVNTPAAVGETLWIRHPDSDKYSYTTEIKMATGHPVRDNTTRKVVMAVNNETTVALTMSDAVTLMQCGLDVDYNEVDMWINHPDSDRYSYTANIRMPGGYPVRDNTTRKIVAAVNNNRTAALSSIEAQFLMWWGLEVDYGKIAEILEGIVSSEYGTVEESIRQHAAIR